jgi:serine/threonine protein kinase
LGDLSEIETGGKMMLAIGALVDGKYQIEGHLGSGGMAEVYKANQTSLNRPVALKVLKKEFNSDAVMVDRFIQEAKDASRLNHPNIVKIIEVGEEPIHDIYYFAMEYVEGQSLAEMLHATGPLPPQTAAHITQQVCEALEHSHKNGIIHRDVKPENIMIDSVGAAKLTDFGIAKAADGTRLTMTGQTFGTPPYMSPEQCNGQPVDGRSDLYSLGIVLYQMLTGAVPFGNANTSAVAVAQAHLYQTPVPPRQLNPAIPAWVEGIVLKALAKNPQNRYQRAHEMSHALGVGPGGYTGPQVFKHSEQPVTSGSGVVVTQPARSPVWMVGATVLSLLLIAGAIFFYVQYTERVREDKFTMLVDTAEGQHNSQNPHEAEQTLNEAFALGGVGDFDKFSAAKNLEQLIQADLNTLDGIIRNIQNEILPKKHYKDLPAELKKALAIDPDNADIAGVKRQAVNTLATLAKQALADGRAALKQGRYPEGFGKLATVIELAELGPQLDADDQNLTSLKGEAEREVRNAKDDIGRVARSHFRAADTLFREVRTIGDSQLTQADSRYSSGISLADTLLRFENDGSLREERQSAQARLNGVRYLSQLNTSFNSIFDKNSDLDEMVQNLKQTAESMNSDAPAVLRNHPALADAKYSANMALALIYKGLAKAQLDNGSYNAANTSCDKSLQYMETAANFKITRASSQLLLDVVLINIDIYLRAYEFQRAANLAEGVLEGISADFRVEEVGQQWDGWRVIGSIYAIFFAVAAEENEDLKRNPDTRQLMREIGNWLPPNFDVNRVSMDAGFLKLALKNFDLYQKVDDQLGGTPPKDVEALHLLVGLTLILALAGE